MDRWRSRCWALFAMPGTVRAGKLSWLDDVVKEVVREAEAGGKVVAKGTDEAAAAAKNTGRLFAREAADEGLDLVARRTDEIGRIGKSAAGRQAKRCFSPASRSCSSPNPKWLKLLRRWLRRKSVSWSKWVKRPSTWPVVSPVRPKQ